MVISLLAPLLAPFGLLYFQVTPLCFLVAEMVFSVRVLGEEGEEGEGVTSFHPVLTVPPSVPPSVPPVKSASIQPALSLHTARFVALVVTPLVSTAPLLNIFMMLATWFQVRLSWILDHWLLPSELAEPLLNNPLNSIFANALLFPSGAVV